MLESYAVTNLLRITSVDADDVREGKIFLIIMRWSNGALDNIARLQAPALDLLGIDLDVVG